MSIQSSKHKHTIYNLQKNNINAVVANGIWWCDQLLAEIVTCRAHRRHILCIAVAVKNCSCRRDRSNDEDRTRDLFAVADFLVTNYDHVFVFVLLVWLLERRNSITATVASVAADLATCSICLGLFVNPKSLPCLHAFCLECLRDSFKNKRPGDKVPCPVCRKEFQIPANGLRSLQHHFIVQQLVDLQLGICTQCQTRNLRFCSRVCFRYPKHHLV